MNQEETLTQLPNTDTHTCFACSPRNPSGLQMKFYVRGDTVVSWVTVPGHLCGWNNLVHGGVLSTVLDEIMSWSAMYLLKQIVMTRTMTVEFLKPVFVGHKIRAEGRVMSVERQRNAQMEGVIYNDTGEVCVRSTGSFVLISPAVAKRMGVMDAVSLDWFKEVIRS